MPSLPFRATITGVTSIANDEVIWFPDYYVRPFSVTVGCVANSTTIGFSLQHTLDDITSSTFASSTADWFTSSGISAATATAFTNYTFPVTALRITSTGGSSISSTNTIDVSFVQAG